MKKVLTSLALGAAFGVSVLPVVAMAQSANLEGVLEEDLEAIGDFGEIIQAEAPGTSKGRKGPKRTNILSGIEYTKTTFDNSPQITNLVKIYADGNTRINDNFRISYVVSERDQYKGQNDDKQPGRINFNLTPRFEQWVSPRFNYFVAVGYRSSYEKIEDNPNTANKNEEELRNEQTYRIKPGFNFNLGKSFLGLTGEYNYKEHNKAKGFNIEANYVYRWKSNVNVGLKGMYSEAGTDNDSRNKNLRALINYRFKNRVRVEGQVVMGREGNDAKDDNENQIRRGYDYTYYNLNTNIPINSTFHLVFNLSYKVGDQYNPGSNTNGDREQFFTKFAIVSKF